MADGDGQRVCGIVRRRHDGEPQNQLHHLLHLVLLGAPVADDCAFDFGGRVFDNRQASLDGREHCDAARMTQLERAPDIVRVEQIFDGDAVGAALREKRREPGMNDQQLRGELGGGGRGNRSADHDPMARPVGLDAAVAGAL
jgi:hypothetical protein